MSLRFICQSMVFGKNYWPDINFTSYNTACQRGIPVFFHYAGLIEFGKYDINLKVL